MRNNLPVTSHEYPIPPGHPIVSVTDMKGRITYCNPAFVEASGYTREELLGQAHNILRHPDMPAEAFRDMWATIEAGLPWSGLVKNRRKNGDFYWVHANATPMRDGERIIGYLSVRTAPSRAAVAGAQALYTRMNEAQRSGRIRHRLQRGQWVRTGWRGWLGRVLAPGTQGQLLWIQIAAAALMVAPQLLNMPLPITLAAAVCAVALGFLSTRQLALAPLHRLIAAANRLAAGDLSHPVSTAAAGLTGQLQQALKQMSVNLRAVVQDVRDDVGHLGTAIHEIASGNADLAARTESQAASLQQTAASMEQINSTVQQTADAAARGAQLAQDTSAVTLHSNTAVQAVAQSMAGISASSQQIGVIIQLIESVAFQTNILALNAAVEAARAGDSGRGFAVVASEVRLLAQRTASAAGEIRQHILESAQRVAIGNARTADAGTRMQEAIAAVSKVDSVLGEISASANEQLIGITQVGNAVAQMDAITQQNAALVEQLAMASVALSERADDVRDAMQIFRLGSGEPSLAHKDAVALRRAGKGIAQVAA